MTTDRIPAPESVPNIKPPPRQLPDHKPPIPIKFSLQAKLPSVSQNKDGTLVHVRQKHNT
ncbi:hypothetical protein CPB83DRAFT_846426 [Crepidotus variabilis]|uniref:Uncharacterized protein n=1 Tax=Crepidotus variabilis TaxID=179855 RepID=A0A9P6JUT8_9AGAR|nr:hypothetical protein CPB83DRAFT_846426 [Crepidotus variabilis]